MYNFTPMQLKIKQNSSMVEKLRTVIASWGVSVVIDWKRTQEAFGGDNNTILFKSLKKYATVKTLNMYP